MQGTFPLRGTLQHTIHRGFPANAPSVTLLTWAWPWQRLAPEVRAWRQRNLARITHQLARLQLMRSASRASGYPFFSGTLWLLKIDGLTQAQFSYGLASLRVVTNAGRDEVVDEFDAATAAGFDLTTFNFHALGTGSVAENATDTALGTELTTEYTGNVRATGTQSQPTSNVYRTVGLNTLDAGTPAVTEHGILTQAATGGGTLWDRSVFAAINLVGANGDALQSTYDLSIASGG